MSPTETVHKNVNFFADTLTPLHVSNILVIVARILNFRPQPAYPASCLARREQVSSSVALLFEFFFIKLTDI